MEYNIDIPFDQFTVLDISSADAAALAEASVKFDLPYLSNFLDDAHFAQDFGESNIRFYAKEICETGTFSVLCPRTGKTVELSSTYVFDDLSTLLFFIDEDTSFALFASDLSLGFPITNYVDFTSKTCLKLHYTFWDIKQKHFSILEGSAITVVRAMPESRSVALITGDSNFAHHAWNELSTLMELAKLGLDQSVELYVCHEPLGPINDILKSKFKVSAKISKGQVHPLNGQDKLLVAVGGHRISAENRQRVLDFAGSQLGKNARKYQQAAKAASNTLWISVRTRNRTMSNQVAVLSHVASKFLDCSPNTCIVLDGHTLPHDHAADTPVLAELNNGVVHDDKQTIKSITAMIRESHPDAEIYSTCGLSIPEALVLAQEVDLYVCHHGTVQHKVGWFANLPGIVHCNRRVLETRPAHWVAEKSEVAMLPTYVPDELIVADDDHEYADQIQENLATENYHIRDADEFADFVIGFWHDVRKHN